MTVRRRRSEARRGASDVSGPLVIACTGQTFSGSALAGRRSQREGGGGERRAILVATAPQTPAKPESALGAITPSVDGDAHEVGVETKSGPALRPNQRRGYASRT